MWIMRLLTSIVLLLPVVAFGQESPDKQAGILAGTPVLAPNRLSARVLAERAAATRAPKVQRAVTTAPMLVDANGAAVGRFVWDPGWRMLVTIGGKTAALDLMQYCGEWTQFGPGQFSCLHSVPTGVQISPIAGTLFFESPDCSGPPYLSEELPYQARGVSLFDPSDGKQYVYFFDQSIHTSMSFNSWFNNSNGCHAESRSSEWAVPLTSVLPVESFGKPPFVLH
jgi:hypothetical protein